MWRFRSTVTQLGDTDTEMEAKHKKKIKLNKLIVENVNKFIFGQFIKVVFSH